MRSAEGERGALLLETGYYGGLRVSELVSLTWGRLLDREDGKMQIAGLVGKGGKAREVLLPADLAARLRAYRQGAEHDEPVFKGRPSTLRTAVPGPLGRFQNDVAKKGRRPAIEPGRVRRVGDRRGTHGDGLRRRAHFWRTLQSSGDTRYLHPR